MQNRYFHFRGGVVAFSPLQIAEGHSQDLQELTEAEKQAFLNPPQPVDPIEEIRKRAKAASQTYRDLFLGRLAGIAIFSEDPAVIDECALLRQQLLDMTQDPDYLAAETFDAMEAALLERYRAIAAGASEAIRNVFREMDA